MTDAPSQNYDELYPALDGPNSISSNNSANNNQHLIHSASTSATPALGSTNLIANKNNNNNNPTVTNSWSVPNHPQQHPPPHQVSGQPQSQQQQTKLNYHLLLSNSQQIQQLYQQQQVLNHLVNPDTSSNSMVSQYNIQPPQQSQPQQQQQQTKIISNNNNNTMQGSLSIHQKRPGLPNPIISSERCSTFKIAPEERRHRDLEQSKILKEIMQKTNTRIEVTTTKDGALNFCIIGKEASLQAAKNLVLNDFQTSVTLTVSVPKSVHGRLLGPKGTRLASIQDETQTKITVPRKEEDSDVIKVVGLKNNAEQAIRSIQKFAREFAGKAVERVTVERIYLLFITGPFNENLKRWEELGAKVSTSGGILPSQNERESGHVDEVTFTIAGETSAVAQVKEEILHIYEDKKKKCTTVNMEVKKAQHRYILGPGGQNLRNLFAKTGVSVELPQESESETITLRGERSKLAPALSELYTQAHSETDDYFEAESWLHKYLIGVRKTNFIDFKALGVDVKSLDDKIKLHGPPTEVENIKDTLEGELEKLKKTIIRKDIRVEPRIHGYIIGKSGATVDQIREDSGAYVLVPKNDEPSEFITLEGTAEAVAIAEEKINAIAKRYEASRILVIDQQLHGSIIGRGGEKIKSIREKFARVVFTFPDQGSKNNEIMILGPADEVDECYNYLDEFHKQLQENNQQIRVPIRKDILKYLPDAQPAIKRIKVDLRVKVDLFISNNDNANKGNPAKQPQKVTSTAVNESSTGTTTENATAEGGDTKRRSGKGKNKKQQLGDGATTKPSDDTTAKSADAVNSSDSGESYAIIIGRKEDVDQAKVKIIKLFDELATTTEYEIKVSPKLRAHLGPKTRLYRQLLDDFQQKIVISFPSSKPEKQSNNSNSKQQVGGDEVTNQNAETNGVPNKREQNRIDIVKIRGPKTIAKKAEKRFETLIAECQEKVDKSFVANVSVETAIFEKFLYADKTELNKIRDTHSVKLTIPDKRDTAQLQCMIVGYEKNVQSALKEFKNLVKEVEEREEETIEIASQVHPRLIGVQGRAVKKLIEDFKVGVKFARQGDPNPNSVILSGRKDSILAAKTQMMKLAGQYLSAPGRAYNSNNLANNSNTSATTNNNNSQQQKATEVNVTGNAE